jgi:type VI secretion system lysozyme-like protein
VTVNASRLAPAPLFDRLVDLDPAVPSEPVPRRALDAEALRTSVLNELFDLLNTRCPFTEHALQGRGRTTLEYGLADVSPAYPGASASSTDVAARMRDAIAAYEPRLRQVQVAVEPVDGKPMQLLARVQGVLAAGSTPAPVYFTICVGAPGGRLA